MNKNIPTDRILDFIHMPSTDKWLILRERFYDLLPIKQEHLYSHAEHIEAHFTNNIEWAPLRNFFFERLCAAEFHWFFVQGVDTLMSGYYIPAVSSFLNGIEASLRVTIDQWNKRNEIVTELSPYRVLSNNLILNGREIGLPVEYLKFPGEEDFEEKLASQKPNRMDVEIVRQRNNICHGNIFDYINRDLGPENSYFTPVSVRDLSFKLLDVSGLWAEHLGGFRRKNGFLDYGINSEE